MTTHRSTHDQESHMATSTIDISHIIPERIEWRPVKTGETGYVSEARVMGRKKVWFAIEGAVILVPEVVVERMALAYDKAAYDALLADPEEFRRVLQGWLADDREQAMDPKRFKATVVNSKTGERTTYTEQGKVADVTQEEAEADIAALDKTDPNIGEQVIAAIDDVLYTKDSAKNLADGLVKIDGFEADLHDPALGHKAIADKYPFTSETSVRRYRKAQSIEVVK